MNTGEIILNIVLAMGGSALVAAGMIVVPNHDRIRIVERFRSVVLEGRAASSRLTIAEPSGDLLENADIALAPSLAE